MVDVLGGEKKKVATRGARGRGEKEREKRGETEKKNSVQGVKFTKATTILYSSTLQLNTAFNYS